MEFYRDDYEESERLRREEQESKERRLLMKDTAKGFSQASAEHLYRNEDAYICHPEFGVFGVFDHLGGHDKSVISSEFVAKHAERNLQALGSVENIEDVKARLEQWFIDIDVKLKEFVENNGVSSNEAPPQTTAVVVVLAKGGDEKRKLVCGHVGDSRAYLYRKANNTLQCLTLDDSSMYRRNPELASLDIQRQLADALTSEEFEQLESDLQEAANEDTSRHLTQTVGGGVIDPHIQVIDVEQGDWLLLTSDGITDNVRDSFIEKECKRAESPVSLTNTLIQRSFQAALNMGVDRIYGRRKKDDMTVVATEIT